MGRGRSDETLVRRAAAGDRAAFDELVQRHRDRVWAVVLRVTRNTDDAEDALQEAFVSAWRALPRFDGRARFSTWLYRIAMNAALDAVGRRRDARSLDEEGVREPVAPGDAFAAHALRRSLERAVADLPVEFRTAVLLCDVAGLGAGEAAEVLDLPVGTVKSRVFRGRALLAAALREPEGAADVREVRR